MSMIKNTFGQYFNSILSLPDDASSADIKIKIGDKDYKANINDYIFITMSLPEKLKALRISEVKGMPFDEFIIIFDGVPFSDAKQYTIDVAHQGPINIKEVEEWNKELFKGKGKEYLENIKNLRGLSEKIIKEFKIGYKEDTNEVVFPVFNYTGEGISALNFYDPIKLYYKRNIGSNRLLGYHEIIQSKFFRKQVFLANDVFDMLFLKDLGYEAIAPIPYFKDEWGKFISNLKIIIYSNHYLDYFESITQLNIIKNIPERLFEEAKKKGWGKAKIDSLIANSKKVDSNYLSSQMIIDEKLQENKKEIVYFSQTNVNNIQYYGIKTSVDNYLLTSERSASSIDLFAKSPNYIFKYHPDAAAKLRTEAFEKFTQDDYTPSKDKVFSMTRSFIKEYIYLPEERTYDLIGLWIIGTYLFLNFEHYPYIHLQAPKGSGKSTLLEILSHICFNASYETNPTPATIFRSINDLQSTVLLDEVEDFKNNSSQRDILSILNQGYSHKGFLPRVKGDNVVYYEVYSPKVFAGINKINDVLLSRSIKINLQPVSKMNKKLRFRPSQIKIEEKIKKIVDEMYLFGLTYSNDINAAYNKIEELQEVEDLSGRELDTWSPIFSIAQVVDKSGKLNLVKKMKEYVSIDRELKAELEDMTPDIKIASFLAEYINENNSVKESNGFHFFHPQNLFESAKQKADLPSNLKTPKSFSGYLKREFDMETKPERIEGKDPERHYKVDPLKLGEILKSKGIDLDENELLNKKDEEDTSEKEEGKSKEAKE